MCIVQVTIHLQLDILAIRKLKIRDDADLEIIFFIAIRNRLLISIITAVSILLVAVNVVRFCSLGLNSAVGLWWNGD